MHYDLFDAIIKNSTFDISKLVIFICSTNKYIFDSEKCFFNGGPTGVQVVDGDRIVYISAESVDSIEFILSDKFKMDEFGGVCHEL